MRATEVSQASSHQNQQDTGFQSLVIDLLGDLLRAPSDQLDAAIRRALEQLGRQFNATQAHVFRYNACEEVLSLTHVWQPDDGGKVLQADNADATKMVDVWRSAFDAGSEIEIRNATLLPDGTPEKAFLTTHDMHAPLMLPMLAGGVYSGFVCLDAGQNGHAFQPDEVHLLKVVADAISNVHSRVDSTDEILKTRDSLAKARNRLQATLNALPELILEVDADGRYRHIHTGDPGQMILPPEDVLGKTHEEVTTPEIAALNRHAMAEAATHGRSGPHPFEIETPRGLRRYSLTVTLRPADRPAEEPGYVFISRDVTEEWRLQRETERLSLLGRHMTNLVVVSDAQHRIEWINPAFEERTGWTLAEVRGMRPQEVARGELSDPVVGARIDAGLAELRPVREEIVNYARDGTPYWVDAQIYPIFDPNNRHTGYVTIETDVTERKRQAAELERLAREANEARARLEMAVDALPDAFVSYDAEDRLVLCNKHFKGLYPRVAHLMVPGKTFAEIARAAVEMGEVPSAVGREEEWLADRIKHHLNPGAAAERRLRDGRWVRIIERNTADGGRVGMSIDITELKHAEQRLADIIVGAQVGTWEWTIATGENLISARWAEIVGYTVEELAPHSIDVWNRLVHPNDLQIVERALERIFNHEIDQFEVEVRVRHKAGHFVWVMSRGRVSRWSPDDTPEVMVGVHIDVSALKRAEERLEGIIDAASAGTWELDVAGEQMHVNERWAEMVGYSWHELSKLPYFGFLTLIHPEDLTVLSDQHEHKLPAGKDTFTNEIRMRHRNGHWIWILSSGQVVARDDNGRPLEIAGIHIDITERKQLEAQLVAERDYLARLMDTSASGIAVMDGQGQIIFANREAECILGRNLSVMQEMRFDAADWQIKALDGADISRDDLPFPRAMAERGIVRDVRISISRPDGARRMLSLNATPIEAEGLRARVVVSINDITEQVVAENELRAAAERADAANRAKSQFLANMSHEIRTPLNGVLGMAQIMESELSEQRHLEMLNIIRESGEMLLAILNDVLDMSKIEAGKLALEAVVFAPAEVASRIEGLHRQSAVEKGLKFDIHLDASARQSRRGDPNRVSQVLHNLVGNAVKFTETGSVTVTMQSAAEGALQITVRDTGIGMTSEQVVRVFEDFEQADGTVTRRFGGTGLGMSIVRKLVALMGGEINVQSAPGEGTEVTVSLPLPIEAPEPAPAQAPKPLSGLRVLAADDDPTNLLVLRLMLSTLGIEAVLVEDGRAAVDAWEPGRFDVVMLDISMPRLDGRRALAEIRAREAELGAARTPVLVISANAMTHQVAEYLSEGFVAHVAKPYRRAAVEEALFTAIAKP